MISYLSFKEYICRLFGHRDYEPNEDDVLIELRNMRTSHLEAQPLQLCITNEELNDLYIKVCAMPNDGLELHNHDYYELAIDIDYPFIRRNEFPTTSEDVTNGIKYELGYPSIEYCAYLILTLKQYIDEHIIRPSLPMRMRRPMDYVRNLDDGENITLASLLPRMIGEMSLKISTQQSKPMNTFRTYKTSFCFEFMYLSDLALVEFSDVADLFRINMSSRNRFDLSQIDTPPLRRYTTDVVDYYKLALASNDPYIKYISCYHVIEYFFDEVFKKKMVNDIKNRITHPDFSYKNDDKVYDVALFIKNRLKMNDEAGQGNELESLKYVLNEYINIDELKARVDSIEPQSVRYYANNKVAFCNAPIITWNDMQGVYTQLAKRIYYTRNSLVHSKSGKNQERYRPYKNEPQLQKEIPLVKAVSELIIINSSDII